MKDFLIASFLCILFQTNAQTEIVRGDTVIWPVGLYFRMGSGVLTNGQDIGYEHTIYPAIGSVVLTTFEAGYKWRIIDFGVYAQRSIGSLNKTSGGPSGANSYYYYRPYFWNFSSVQAEMALNAYIRQTPFFIKGAYGTFNIKSSPYYEQSPQGTTVSDEVYSTKGTVWSVAAGVHYRHFWTMIDCSNYLYLAGFYSVPAYTLSAGTQFSIGKRKKALAVRPLTPFEKRRRLNLTAGVAVLTDLRNGGGAASPMIGLNYWISPKWSLDTRLSLHWVNLGNQDPRRSQQNDFNSWPTLKKQQLLQLQTQYRWLQRPAWQYNLVGGIDLIEAQAIGPEHDPELRIPAHTTSGLALGLGISNPILSMRLMYHYTWSAFPNFWEWSTMINLREPTRKR